MTSLLIVELSFRFFSSAFMRKNSSFSSSVSFDSFARIFSILRFCKEKEFVKCETCENVRSEHQIKKKKVKQILTFSSCFKAMSFEMLEVVTTALEVDVAVDVDDVLVVAASDVVAGGVSTRSGV